MKKRPKVGLAIGAGAAYGLSAVGILKVLEENGIKVDVISGTSIGAVVGALYASGMKSYELEEILFSVEWKELLDFVMPKKGIVRGKKVESFLRDVLKNKRFKSLEIPLYIAAVDINSGKLVIFDKGDVTSAVRASIAIPGVFTPVEMGNMFLVDGGVLDPLPVDLIKKHCDIVIAIDYETEKRPDIYARAKKREHSDFFEAIKKDFLEAELKYIDEFLKHGKLRIPLPFRWFLSPNHLYKMLKKKSLPVSSFKILEVARKSHHIMANEMARLKLKLYKPDILIKPDLTKMNWLEFDKGPYALKQGEIAAKQKLDDIKKILRKRKR